MSDEHHFWLNWFVNVGVAIGTFAVALVALFGEYFRSKFFPPQLQLRLLRPEGEKTCVRLSSFGEEEVKERWEDARYYHLNVVNLRRWSPATQVQVFLMRVEEPGPDGEPQVAWSGDVPIRWRHQEVFPPARTVGPSADCDLCSVSKGKWLKIHPLVVPTNLNACRREKTILFVSLQARSNQADSPIIRVQISWDGSWEDGNQEMKRHLTVTVP